MRIDVAVVGSVAEQMRREIAAGERAVSAAVSEAAKGLQSDWRRQIANAGLGARLQKTIRMAVYPSNRVSLSAAAMVWTKAPHIIRSFDEGSVIRADSRDYLAIPTPAAGRFERGNKRITPAGWQRRTGLRLRRVMPKGGYNAPVFLVADDVRLNRQGLAVYDRTKRKKFAETKVIFILVPQVKLRKRLDIASLATKWGEQVPGLIVGNWLDDKLRETVPWAYNR